MTRQRVRMARRVRREDADRSFDVEFWQRAGAEARLAAMWEMVVEAELIRGGDGRTLRLDRSVASVRRRRRAKRK